MATINDIFLESRFLVDADSTSYPDASLLRRNNQNYEQVVGMLINSDGTWQFDSSGYSDFPIGVFTLVNGQAKYSFNDQFLQLEEVQIMNKNGDYQIIHPIDQKEFSDTIPLEEAYRTNGCPQFYDKISDDTIKLFPAPDNGVSVTLVAGLKVKFKRTADIFTTAELATGTKTPGFASPWHMLLAYMNALPYAQSYKKDRVTFIETKIQQMTKELKNHYGRRQKDIRKKATMRGVEYR